MAQASRGRKRRFAGTNAAGASWQNRRVALDVRRARRHFAAADPLMLALMARIGPCRLDTRVAPDAFTALVRAIVAQQVSAKAAATVFARVIALMPAGRLRAGAILDLDPEMLRATGLGPTKTRYVRELAARVDDGRLPVARLSRMDDDAVVERLVDLPGIGRWTAEVFLIFQLQRPDVFPADDLALLSAMARVYGWPARPKAREARVFAERWQPYRSIASWYLWRSISP